MEKKIIKYISFTSTEDFEKWQIDNDVFIISVNPIPSEVEMPTTRGGYMVMNVFVLYFKGE